MLLIINIAIIISYILKNNNQVYYNIMYGLLSSFIVTFVTSLCEFYSLREQFKNDMYIIYLEWYKCYYIENKKIKDNHFDVKNMLDGIQKHLGKTSPLLSNYCGLFKKKDKLYYMIDPYPMDIHMFKAKDLSKCIKNYNNVDLVKKYIAPFFKDLENILCEIDKKRFKNDIKLYDYNYRLFIED